MSFFCKSQTEFRSHFIVRITLLSLGLTVSSLRLDVGLLLKIGMSSADRHTHVGLNLEFLEGGQLGLVESGHEGVQFVSLLVVRGLDEVGANQETDEAATALAH